MYFFMFIKISMSNGYISEIFKWAFILMDFMGFSFKISKLNSPYHLITTFFNRGFRLVLGGFINE
jgi:hypothetical protein